MAIQNSDITYHLSGGAANTSPAASLGGARSTAAGGQLNTGSLNNLFEDITGDVAAVGHVDYRCIYIRNGHSSLSWLAPKVWIKVNTLSPDTDFAIALAGEGPGGVAETVANETTAPSGEVFSSPTGKATGLQQTDVSFGQSFAVWVRRTVNAGAQASNDTVTLRAEGDTLP